MNVADWMAGRRYRRPAILAVVLIAGLWILQQSTDATVVVHRDGDGPLAIMPGTSSEVIVQMDSASSGASFGMFQPCIMDGGDPITLESVRALGWIGPSEDLTLSGAWVWTRPDDAMPFISVDAAPPDQSEFVRSADLVALQGFEVSADCPGEGEPAGSRPPTEEGRILDIVLSAVPQSDRVETAIEGLKVRYRRGAQVYEVEVDAILGVCGKGRTDSCVLYERFGD